MEELLLIFLLAYVIMLVIDEGLYLIRGYRVVRYEPRRRFEVIDLASRRRRGK